VRRSAQEFSVGIRAEDFLILAEWAPQAMLKNAGCFVPLSGKRLHSGVWAIGCGICKLQKRQTLGLLLEYPSIGDKIALECLSM
jgi:hypothetical protein